MLLLRRLSAKLTSHFFNFQGKMRSGGPERKKYPWSSPISKGNSFIVLSFLFSYGPTVTCQHITCISFKEGSLEIPISADGKSETPRIYVT